MQFQVLKGQMEIFKKALEKFILQQFPEHSFEGYMVTMDDFRADDDEIKDDHNLIQLHEQMKIYSPANSNEITETCQKLIELKKELREKKLRHIQKVAQTPHIVWGPKFYCNLRTDEKIIQLNDGSISIEEMGYSEPAKWIDC